MMFGQPAKVILVCATTQPVEIFNRATLLGRSLSQLPEITRPRLILLSGNIGEESMGLSEFYNQAIEGINEEGIVVFIHDDVYIHDWNLGFTLLQALGSWDIVGAAGSSAVPYGQAGWLHALIDGVPFKNEHTTTSGLINHFDPYSINPDYFGPSPMECDLLDGVFLAAQIKTLKESNLRFDPQFRFHCYDSDFCYTAKSLGLSMGTWPLQITHGSIGDFGSADWVEAARKLELKLRSKPVSQLQAWHQDATTADEYSPKFKTPKFRNNNLQ